MTDERFTDTIEKKLALVAPTLRDLEAGGDQSYLRELQALLRRTWKALSSCSSAIRAWTPQRRICMRRQPLL